jgi:hypothetical protein
MLVILCGRYPQLKICELVLLGWRLVYLLLLLWWLLMPLLGCNCSVKIPLGSGKEPRSKWLQGSDDMGVVLLWDPSQLTEMRDHKGVTYRTVSGSNHALDALRNHPPNLNGLPHQDAIDG